MEVDNSFRIIHDRILIHSVYLRRVSRQSDSEKSVTLDSPARSKSPFFSDDLSANPFFEIGETGNNCNNFPIFCNNSILYGNLIFKFYIIKLATL